MNMMQMLITGMGSKYAQVDHIHKEKKLDTKIYWPNGNKFAICLSHDVDRVRKSYQYLTYFIKTKNWYHIKSFFKKDYEPYWNFEKIMKLENSYGVRSTFFFLNERKKLKIWKPETYPLSLGYYDINSEKVVNIIRKLDRGGWEIGVHGSYDSYKNKDLLIKEKRNLEKILNKRVFGIRQHYLNLEIPNTWILQESTGFKYDSSFGWNNKVGFRGERFLPFKPINSDFLVIPLTIMDTALFKNSKNLKDAWKKVDDLLKFAEKKGGLITILWHQRVFNDHEFYGWGYIYEKIIKEGLKRGAWFARCIDIYKLFL